MWILNICPNLGTRLFSGHYWQHGPNSWPKANKEAMKYTHYHLSGRSINWYPYNKPWVFHCLCSLEIFVSHCVAFYFLPLIVFNDFPDPMWELSYLWWKLAFLTRKLLVLCIGSWICLRANKFLCRHTRPICQRYLPFSICNTLPNGLITPVNITKQLQGWQSKQK